MLNKQQLLQQYDQIKAKGLNLDMSRGKPGADVLSLCDGLLKLPGEDFRAADGLDCRNYGVLDGLPEAKELFAPIFGVSPDNVIIGGNSSLQMMYDAVVRAMVVGVSPEFKPWGGSPVKFLCLVPGYDRHFSICESLGIEMINIYDISQAQELAAQDESIKGMWCVPMYSNPTGKTFCEETVRRIASMKTKAADFRVFWDNAYAVHHLSDTPDTLVNILDEENPDRVYMFASTSKITFPGGGLGIMAASDKNIAFIKKHMSYQTIGSDKLNQLRHVMFFKNYDGIVRHMQLIKEILKPKFDAVLEILERELSPFDLGQWFSPKGGYFISFDAKPGTAKRIVHLCRQAGVVLTGAGATFPYGKDPDDKNIRIAPTFPPLDELKAAMEVFCVSVKLASIEG
jgi:DNA-binding transcriptional MocR family regulator